MNDGNNLSAKTLTMQLKMQMEFSSLIIFLCVVSSPGLQACETEAHVLIDKGISEKIEIVKHAHAKLMQ